MEGVARTGKPALNQFMTRFLNKASAIPDPGQQAECMEAAAQVLGEVGDADSLLKIAGAFDKAVSAVGPQSPLRGSLLHSQVFVLSALAKTQARVGDRDGTVRNFTRAVELASAMPTEGEGLRSGRLERVARDQVDAGDVEGALQTAKLIVYEYPRATALMSIAAAEAKAGHREEARRLFLTAVETANQIQIQDLRHDHPETSYLNIGECLRTIAFAQAQAGFTKEAVGTCGSISDRKWKNSALSTIAATIARGGDIKSAVRLAEKIDDQGSHARAMQGVAEGQAESGDIQGAMDWAKSQSPQEARTNAILGIVKALAKRPGATQ